MNNVTQLLTVKTGKRKHNNDYNDDDCLFDLDLLHHMYSGLSDIIHDDIDQGLTAITINQMSNKHKPEH